MVLLNFTKAGHLLLWGMEYKASQDLHTPLHVSQILHLYHDSPVYVMIQKKLVYDTEICTGKVVSSKCLNLGGLW